MSRYHRLFVFVIVLAIAAAIIDWQIPLSRGLDIAGGIRVVLQADPKTGDEWPDSRDKRLEKMRSMRKTIQNRIKGLAGVTEPVVRVQDDDRLVVELPGVKDTEDALERIRSTASLEFYYMKDLQSTKNPIAPWKVESVETKDGTAYIFTGPRGETINSIKQPEDVLAKVVGAPRIKPILTGKDLEATARANIRPPNEIIIQIKFNDQGTEIFRDFTRDHVHEYLAVFYDGKLLTCPTIREPIPNGEAEVSGFRSLAEARSTADYLNAGALPIPLKVIAKDAVEPTIGIETVAKVVVAGIVGLLLVIAFMLIYYRLPGMLANVALGLYALFVFAAFKLIHASMSLAGLAALIISVGMAVDANILIFERLKEELRGGKTLRAAIDAGFSRAFTAIFDSNMCTAITCAVLMWFGSPAVQSFAFTLLVGVAISMFTAITVTRTFLHLLVGWEWAQNPALYGLGTSWFAKTGRSLDIVGKRAYYFAISGIVILTGLYFLAQYRLNPGIEFRSGTELQVKFEKPVALDQVRRVVRAVAPGSAIQLAEGRTMAFITTDLQREKLGEAAYNAKMDALRTGLDKKFNVAENPRTGTLVFAERSVEPVVSAELVKNAIIAVIIASIAIVLYLSFRFAIGGLAAGFKYGVCAVIALLHDSAFILGLFAILGRFLGWEVDSLFVTAVLTIIGFSVHDTIVVFDRIRENLRHRLRGESFEQLCNRSILQTFSRSINTSFTVVLTLGALLVLGGPSLRHFYWALLAGIIVGTYSSIFTATPLVIVWEKIASRSKSPRRRAFEDRPMVARPMVSPTDSPATAGNGGTEGTVEEQSDQPIQEPRPAPTASAPRIKRKKKRRC